MRDPDEGLAPDGTIVTGARRGRVPRAFEPLVADLVADATDDIPLYLYGSVATGQAVVGRSDVDVVALGMDPHEANALAGELSQKYRHLTRAVAIGAWSHADLGDDDPGHGNRVFLKHLCVHLAGPDPTAGWPRFQGDAAAVRGFNGDLPQRLCVWREKVAGPISDEEATALARSVGRKTLFAVAGLVSLHDHTWTTDRATAARRWGALHPALAGALGDLLAWGDGTPATRKALRAAVDGPVAVICAQFVDRVGAWAHGGSANSVAP